jgi:4-amino-4-deoxy-L-arabinose transferase-like glycosyltransferase
MRAIVLPIVVLLLAFFLRVYRLTNQSFAFDEGWTSYAVHHPWSKMWEVLAPDNHPPLYYVLVKALAELAGYGDFSLRFLSVVFGTATIAGLYALGRRVGGEVMGLSSALFAACLPSFVYYAQEARMYSLLVALAVLSSYSLAHILDGSARRGWWVCYVAVSAAMLYTHYFALLQLVAQNLLWLLWNLWSVLGAEHRRSRSSFRKRTLAWGLGQITILLLYVPWLPTAIDQVRIAQGTWWRMSLPASVIVRDIWRFFVLGPRRPPGVSPIGLWLGPIAVVGMVALCLGWRRGWLAWALAFSGLALPVGLMVLIGSRLPIYTDRYTLVAVPNLAMVVGLGIWSCWGALPSQRRSETWDRLLRTAAVVLLLWAVVAPLPQLWAYYTDETFWREDFRRAAFYVMSKAKEGDTVVLLGSYQPIMQYYESAVPVLRFPQSGDSVQDESSTVALLRENVRPGSSVRVVMYSWETVDPQSLVEGQLREHCEFRGEHWQRETGQRPIRVLNFAGCDGDFAVEPRQVADAVWEDQVALRGYRLVDVAPGRRGRVILWWTTLRRPDRDYSAFAHLLDKSGEMIVQYDKLPLNAFYPMRAWPIGVEQRDDYLLKVPANADLDGAWLAVGLYNASNGDRLPVLQDGVPVGDFVRIPLTGSVGEIE